MNQACLELFNRLSRLDDPTHYKDTPEPKRELADAMVVMSEKFESWGQHSTATRAMKEAILIYKVLAEQEPQGHRAKLASLLHTLGSSMRQLVDSEEMVDVLREGVALYRDLVLEKQDVYEDDLTLSLHELAQRLADIVLIRIQEKNYPAAIRGVEECIRVWEELALKYPEIYEDKLRASYSDLKALRFAQGLAETTRSLSIPH
jgi:hypothetical protein